MEEEWREIPSMPGWSNYLLSNYGRIHNRNTGKTFTPSSSGGYSVLQGQSIHRLVALTFVPGYFEGAIVKHKDGVINNNRSDNLEWTTPKENQQYLINNNLRYGKRGRFVGIHYPTKLRED